MDIISVKCKSREIKSKIYMMKCKTICVKIFSIISLIFLKM